MLNKTQAERLLEIDALRGIAALCVVVFHFKVMTAYPGGLFGLDTAIGRWANAYLWTAVDLFFVISGFIFAHVYLRDGRLAAGTTLSDYAVARVARIYPLHLLTLAIVAAAVWLGTPLAPSFDHNAVNYDFLHFALNLLMLQASGLEHGFSFNSPAWSLTSEFICYFLFFLFARAGGRWLLLGAMGAIALALFAEVNHGMIPIPSRIGRGLVGFFVGVLLHRYSPALRRIPFGTTFVVAIATIFLVPRLGTDTVNEGVLMSLIAYPWLILLCLQRAVARLLKVTPLQLLGDLSYSIYLIHIPLMLLILAINGGQSFAIEQFTWLVPAYLAALLLLSWLSFRFFETPARRGIRKALGARQAAVRTPA